MEVIHIRQASRQAPCSNHKEHDKDHDYEEGHSIEKEIENEEGKVEEIVLGKERASSHAGTTTDSITDILNKRKSKVIGSLEEVYSYVRSLSGFSMDNLNQPAVSTIGELDEELEPTEEPGVKKWVVYDMVKLGFEEDQIKEAIEYMDNLSEDMPREEMLRKVADHFVGTRQSLGEVVEEWENEQKKETEPEKNGDVVVIDIGQPEAKKEKIQEVEVVKEAVVENKKPVVQQVLVTCQVCFDQFPDGEVKRVLKCSHRFCKPCYSSYLEQLVKTNKVLDITCPYVGCNEKFNDEQIVSLLDTTEGERYTRLKNIAVLNMNPNLRWCIRPGCDKYVIGNGKSRKLVCECKAQICFKCGNQYHMRRSCASAVDKVYKKYSKDQQVQRCPQCKSRVEKNGGCHHMTCARCTYQWCWLCDKKYTYDHYDLSNPAGCSKIKKQRMEEAGQLPQERTTYWSEICQEPMRIIALPLFLLIVAAMVPQRVFTIYMTKKKGREYNAMESTGCVMLLIALLGIAMLPISLGYVTFCVIADGVIDFVLWICKKAVRKDYTYKFPESLMPNVF